MITRGFWSSTEENRIVSFLHRPKGIAKVPISGLPTAPETAAGGSQVAGPPAPVQPELLRPYSASAPKLQRMAPLDLVHGGNETFGSCCES